MIFAIEERASQESSDGFTLLEILVAVAILGMAYLVILQNFSLSLQNISRLERNGLQLLAVQLEMDRHFIIENIDDEPTGEVFVEDGSYKVLLVASEEDERLVTLVIKKR
jgi:prepilin-type N-terminal cleavage/methylation domain-containing protein